MPHAFVKGYGRSVGLADMAYAIRSGRAHRLTPHPARFHPGLPEFFIRFLPDAGDIVMDPFLGSAVTGERWDDGAPFDADGPGTSDLDLTLVGPEAVALYKLDGFFIPKVHSRPISEEDPDIAPALVPLRDRLMKMVGRPVNIQGTRDWIMFFREHVMGQPYLTLIGKAESA